MQLTKNEYVLVVDDQDSARELLAVQLLHFDYPARVARDGEEALREVNQHPGVVAVLTDISMPVLSGVGLLQRLKELDETLQVIMVSGVHDLDTVRECLRQGAYDYLVKPYQMADLASVLQRAIDRTRLLRENQTYRLHLEEMVEEKTHQVRETRDIALITLAKLAESRDNETGLHLERISAYSRILGLRLRDSPYANLVTAEFLHDLERSSALHDIGKVGIPDSILLKAGPLTAEEFEIMKTHTLIGGDTLQGVIEQFDDHTFMLMGMEIAFSHHERWDGGGYPSGLRESDIPLSARIVALTDAYDAITSVRPYKVAHDHAEAIRRIEVDRGKHFDPVIVDAFLGCEQQFSRVKASLQRSAAEGADSEPLTQTGGV